MCCVVERPVSIILVFKSKTNLNSKKSTAVRVGEVLEYQERHHEEEQPAADEQRSTGTRDVAAATSNGTGEQVKSDRQAGDCGICGGHVRKAVFVRIVPVLDRRNQAQAPEHKHDSGTDDEDDTQLR